MQYKWDTEQLSVVRQKPLRRINYNQVKFAIDIVKGLIRKENDPFVKTDLAKAGITLNRILLR